MYHQLKLLSMKGNLHQNHHTPIISQLIVTTTNMNSSIWICKIIIANTKLKSMLLVFDGNWYIGIILECYYGNQDCSIKFTKRNNLNSNWISGNGFSFYQVTFKNLICIIDPPPAVGSSGPQYILGKHDFDKITTSVNRP